jgi:hypothetical protein
VQCAYRGGITRGCLTKADHGSSMTNTRGAFKSTALPAFAEALESVAA